MQVEGSTDSKLLLNPDELLSTHVCMGSYVNYDVLLLSGWSGWLHLLLCNWVGG